MLGVIDRAEEMHSILDAETAGTVGLLDSWFQARGGRRGRAQDRTSTGGLVCAVTRHATSRAGDPSPHDHVLVANVVEMLDGVGGYKGLDSAALRDTVDAATMVGRLQSAWQATQLGYAIERDDGPSGNLRHWRIAGVPEVVCDTFSKRSDEIAEHLAATGQDGYRARGIAARASRNVKRHTGVDQLLPFWRAELDAIGWPVERLTGDLTMSRTLTGRLTGDEIDQLTADVLDVDGRLLANHKAFTRTHLVAELAPRLYGRDPAELDRVLDRVLASREVVPLIGVAGARERTYTTASVLRAEVTIAAAVDALADHAGPAVEPEHVAAAVADAEHERGHRLTAGQQVVVERMCSGGCAVTLVEGVAGSGKTTALDTATTALRAGGYRVIGTSTSGQAARTLGDEAHIDARTFAALLWRLDHGHVRLDDRTVVIVDEAGMADDSDLARLALAVNRSGGSLVLVGDDRQLSAVGPGGAMAALLARRPDMVVTLDANVRQRDAGERRALAELRNGSVSKAVGWYPRAGRIHAAPQRVETLVAMARAWAADVGGGRDAVLLAWRRADVADLNRLARQEWRRLGRLAGEDVELGGRAFAAGDRLVATAPNRRAGIVTSELLAVVGVDDGRLTVRTAAGRTTTVTGDALAHVDYGYAVTVHRAQGATFDRAHVLAAGGGRELAYVTLSRARDRTDIYATADDVGRALDDLRMDWGSSRSQRWLTDGPARPALRVRVGALEHDLRELVAGRGRWADTPAGVAALELNGARDELRRVERVADDPTSGRWERRRAARSLPTLAAAVERAELRWRDVGQPVADGLAGEIAAARQELVGMDRRDRIAGVIERRPERPGPERDVGLSL